MVDPQWFGIGPFLGRVDSGYEGRGNGVEGSLGCKWKIDGD